MHSSFQESDYVDVTSPHNSTLLAVVWIGL